MMTLVIDGCAPWDGRYDFDDFSFTNDELHVIKTVSSRGGAQGIRGGELIDALDANDTAAYVGVAMVMLGRYGHRVDVDDLWNAKVGSVTIVIADLVDPTTPDGGSEPAASTNGSGDASSNDGDPLVSAPSRTGTRSSATPAASDPQTLVT